jgi:hypothetical protein
VTGNWNGRGGDTVGVMQHTKCGLAGVTDDVAVVDDALLGAKDTEVLVVLTEWPQFRALDWSAAAPHDQPAQVAVAQLDLVLLAFCLGFMPAVQLVIIDEQLPHKVVGGIIRGKRFTRVQLNGTYILEARLGEFRSLRHDCPPVPVFDAGRSMLPDKLEQLLVENP